jgi:hypothetical protein
VGPKAASDLTVEASELNIGPGESVPVTLSGLVPSLPAVYNSSLRVIPKDGAPFAVPITFRVAASAAWGFVCMIFGLLLVGIINLLDSESGNQGELRRALLARQSVNELLQWNLAPQSRVAQVENIYREFDAAIAILQQPRRLSFVDRRTTDAHEHLQTAAELTLDLRKALSEKPRGSIEIADLLGEWTKLKDIFSVVSKQFLVPTPSGESLRERLGAFDAWAAQRLLRAPIEYFAGDFTYHVGQVEMLYAAGRNQGAAVQARAVRRWMQRAADFVNKQAQLVTSFVQLSANDITQAERIRQRIQGPGIAEDQRAAILKSLDEAASLLSGTSNWPARRVLTRRIQDLRTETFRAEKDALDAALRSAAAREDREDSIESVQDVIEEGAKLERGADGKVVPEARGPWLRRVVAAWHRRLETLPDPNPPALQRELQTLEAAVAANDLDGVTAHARELFARWAVYSSERAKALILKETAPLCLRLRDDLSIGLEATQQAIRHLEGSSDLPNWEGELDRLRVKINATPDLVESMPPDCLNHFLDLWATADQLRNNVYSAMWNSTILPDVTRREIASDFATSLKPEALASLISDVRPLRIEVATPIDERYVGHQIAIKIGNLVPDWGPGIVVGIDFGDGQSKTTNAEELRKDPTITHEYRDAKIFPIAAIAAEAFEPGTIKPINKALGETNPQQVSVSPSPISKARQLADTFFNARFGLALLIAGLLYFWRYYATKSVFGANAFDYAQAFALGFAISLAVYDLPQKITEFISTKG